jgi:ATP-dependent DNA ligase
VLCAFDLLELDGDDLRRTPIEHRKRTLAKVIRGPHPGIVLSEHYAGDGDIVYRHACKLGCEGIVSKASWLALPLGPLDGLGQDQEPGCAGRAAGG